MILGALIAGISEYGKPRASGDDPEVSAPLNASPW